MTVPTLRNHENNFNLLRFIAASMVLFGHSYPIATRTGVDALTYSWIETTAPHLAVDIFFVISGFLVTGSLIARNDVVSFSIARLLRIVPALLFANLLIAYGLGTAMTTLPWQEYLAHPQTWQYWWQNSFPFVHVQFHLPGVFANNIAGQGVNGSLWTLPWEIQMYSILAVLGAISFLRGSPLQKKGLTQMITLLWIAAVVGLCHYAYRPLHEPWWGMEYDAFRFAVYFFGGALCQLHREHLRFRWQWLLIIVIAMTTERIVKGWWLPAHDANVSFILRSMLFPYLVLFLVFVPKGRLLKFNQLGDYSYGIYIYAYPIQQTIIALRPETGPLLLTALAMPITLLLSVFSWHCIEKPALQLKDRITTPLEKITRWLFPVQKPTDTFSSPPAANLFNTTNIVFTFLALLAAWLSYIQPGTHLYPGLDNSWAYGINYAFANHLVIGRDIYFTFGPLGFLEHSRPLTDNMIYVPSLFWFCISTLMAWCLLQLAWHSSDNIGLRAVNLLIAALLISCTQPFCQRLLLTLYACAFLFWQQQQKAYLYLLAAGTAIALMIKFTYGTASLAFFVPMLALHSWQRRQLRDACEAAALGLATYLLLWATIYGSLDGAIEYIRGGLEFARGSTSAMATTPRNNWPAIGVFYAAFLVAIAIAIIPRSSRHGLLPAVFLLPLFIWSKYAFGLEDSAHLAFLFTFTFFAMSTFALAGKALWQKIAYAALIVVCFFSWRAMHSKETGPPELSFLPQFHASLQTKFLSPNALPAIIADWRKTEIDRLKPLVLPPDMRALIGNAPVDIYPWETIIAAANQLNWAPRPVFQNYITYTPFLDRKNADYLDSDKAPAFIVWHYHDYQDIANRFHLSSDPLTISSLLTHYRIVQCAEQFCLWQRSREKLLESRETPETTIVHWGDWIPVPAQGDIIRASIKATRTLEGKLNLALWKEGGITVSYRLKDGSIRTHNLVIDNASSGVWAAPYTLRLETGKSLEEIDPAMLATLLGSQPAEGYLEDINQTHVGISTRGWGFIPFEDTGKQEMALLLYNNEHRFLLPLQRKFRADITDVYHKRGQVDLDQCGFEQEIALRDLPAGQYNARFIIRNNGRTAISANPDQQLTIVQQQGGHNVEALRFDTGRPWAFTNTLELRWLIQNRLTGNSLP